MKYMLLIYSDPSARPQDADAGEAMSAEFWAFTQEIQASGELVAGDQLAGHDVATSVRLRNGETLTTDGPFAETTEHLGGYYIVDVKDLDRAIELAAKIPWARIGTIEVRPVVDM